MLACLALFNTAFAETASFKFTGKVTFGGPMAIPDGTIITGTFSWNPDTRPNLRIKGLSIYQILQNFSASVGGHQIAVNPFSVSVWNNMGGNTEDMLVIGGGVPVVDGTTLIDGSFALSLASGPGSTKALKNTRLPESIDVTKFDAGPTLNYGELRSDGGPDGGLLQFSIDSIESIDLN